MPELLFKGRTGRVYGPAQGGSGAISLINAPLRGLDGRLYRLLVALVNELRVHLTILSVDTGGHVPGSRHYVGRAVDITAVDGGAVDCHAVTARVDAVTHWLRCHEFGPGEDGRDGHLRCLLFGPAETEGNRSSLDHDHHLHVSVGLNG